MGNGIKVYNGKKYTCVDMAMSKSEANAKKKNYKNMGCLVRIIPSNSKHHYEIYVHSRKYGYY